MFTIKAAKSNFFDRKSVLDAVGRASVKVFNEFGRAVRKRAQKSLVYADGPSAAGAPPHAHKTGTRRRVSKSTGKVRVRSVSFLREFLFYAYDPSTKSVVIGPAKLNSVVSPDALAALEYGGTSTVKVGGKLKRAPIAAHPFMRPAAEAETPGLPAMWRDSVRS